MREQFVQNSYSSEDVPFLLFRESPPSEMGAPSSKISKNYMPCDICHIQEKFYLRNSIPYYSNSRYLITQTQQNIIFVFGKTRFVLTEKSLRNEEF